jgi:NAD(P)-dependent dehydrogenase (short-subunit alcohol dehydrogenase family)
MKNKEINLCHN